MTPSVPKFFELLVLEWLSRGGSCNPLRSERTLGLRDEAKVANVLPGLRALI